MDQAMEKHDLRDRLCRPTLFAMVIATGLGGLTGCGVVDTAGSVVGGAVDLTVDAVDTTTDVVTAPF